jgi:perosamine synthetase
MTNPYLNKRKKIIAVNTPVITKSDALAVYKVVKSGWISSTGNQINKFEEKIAIFVNRKYGAAVSNGTAALEIAIKSLDIKKGDEVLLPSFTIVSCANAVIKNMATPILLESNLETWNIKIEDIEKKITKKTKALLLPHIYGFPNDMDKIIYICKKNKIYLIEDASEMLGQKYKNQPCGSFGDISTFSFYANKHITTGEGGMILTNKKEIIEKIKELRNLNFGKINRFNHTDISWNYRYTNMQAALGLNQLKRIKNIIKRKRYIGNFYFNSLKNEKNITIQPNKLDYAKNIYWVFGVLLKKNSLRHKKLIQKELMKKNIETRPFFWPMHKQDIFKKLKIFKKEKYPNAEYLSNNGFYLPSGLNLKLRELKYIVINIKKIINKYN